VKGAVVDDIFKGEELKMSQEMAEELILRGSSSIGSPSAKAVSFDLDIFPTILKGEEGKMPKGDADALNTPPHLFQAPSLGSFPSLARLGSLSRLGSLPALQVRRTFAPIWRHPTSQSMPFAMATLTSSCSQSARSGDFLQFLNEIAVAESESKQEDPSGAEDSEDISPGVEDIQSRRSPREDDMAGLAETSTSAQAVVDTADNELFSENEDLFKEALETTKISGVDLKQYFLKEDRAGDILFYKRDNLPWFEREKIRRDGRDKIPGKFGASDERPRTVTRISDKQEECICSLRPMLMFPGGDKGGWIYKKLQGPQCCGIRNTSKVKKQLGNYKYTGFCADHVEGNGAASRQFWIKHKKCAVRGFNLERNVNDRRMRHILCLESSRGLVFLKWCTQCHLWKNFKSFTQREGQAGDKSSGAQKGQLMVHTFCSVCHQRQVLSRDKRRIERANKRKLAKGDTDLDEVAEKLHLRKKAAMESAAIKAFAMESTASKFWKFSKTIFENVDEKPMICGVFGGTAEDMIMVKAMEMLIDLQSNPLKHPSSLGSGRWVQVAQDLIQSDLNLPGGDAGPVAVAGDLSAGLTRQGSLDYWAQPSKKELIRRGVQDALQVDDIRYKVILLGALLVEERLSMLLNREVTLEAMYEGCILTAFSMEEGPNGEDILLTAEQQDGLMKMGWGALHLKQGSTVTPLVDGPSPGAEDVFEMLGVKRPPLPLLIKSPESLSNLYPLPHIYASQGDVGGLMEQIQGDDLKRLDWQGCTGLHHAVLNGPMDNVTHMFLKQLDRQGIVKANRRGFTPLEVAALGNSTIFPHVVAHLLQMFDLEEAKKTMSDLEKTLESAIEHTRNDLVKTHATSSLAALRMHSLV